jgi:hypothetical protein
MTMSPTQPPARASAKQQATPTVTELIDSYCAVWNEPNPARRQQLLAKIWGANATYTDPTVHTSTADELLGHIAQAQARRPGAKVVRTSEVDAHHGLARFAWHVVQADGTSLPEGLDIAEISPDGKIQRIVGFFGPLAST